MGKRSISYLDCPAKSYTEDLSGKVALGFNVSDHTYIVGRVARELISLLPDFIKNEFMPDGAELIAACHDIGKVSPTFYLKLACQVFEKDHFDCQLIRNYFDKKDDENSLWGGHATVSAVTLKKSVKDRYIFKIAGSHHGALHHNLRIYDHDGFDFGGEEWHQERVALIDNLKDRLHTDFPIITNETQAKILSGLTTVSDWIGSGGIYSIPYPDWENELDVTLSKTLSNAGFHSLAITQNLDFNQLFGNDFKPNNLQTHLFNKGIVQGLNIVEAPMGMGKTEAALWFAYKCLAQGLATGIYFAMPTQLTSNMIYTRFNKFLQVILENQCLKSQLIHSNAWLAVTTLGEDGDVGGSWFDHRKRSLLAPFGVGTIDQALMSVVNVRHNFVRSFGLMGKVVILDEVHSYDVYTGLLLDELIKQLLDMKCTVIILSATLTKERRRQLVPKFDAEALQEYPIITTYSPQTEDILQLPFKADIPTKHINLQLKTRSLCFETAISRLLRGEYVIWIENTVNEAIETYKDFMVHSSQNNFKCGVLHSRFTLDDRNQIENQWVPLFGKKNIDRYCNQGFILIGTQILEQSLDIDADYMVSNLAPIDLILQRTGRLWRHDRPNRITNLCNFDIIAPKFNDGIDKFVRSIGPTAFVYEPYLLMKTYFSLGTLIESQNKILSIPDDVTHIIESVYADAKPEIEQEIAHLKHEMIYGNKHKPGLNAMRQKARSNLAGFGMPITPDTEAMTRHITDESIELLVVKDINTQDGQLILKAPNGALISIPKHPDRIDKKTALQLMQMQVKIDVRKLNKSFLNSDLPKQLKQLNRSKRNSIFLCKITSNGLVHWNGETLSDKYIFKYNEIMGLTVMKKEDLV